MKQIRTSAPTRIDLAGGTLDIWPLYLFHEHAQTLNAAISLRAHAEITARTDGRLRLESIDTSKTVEVGRWQDLADGQGLPLLSRLAYFFRAENLTLRTRGESPAGAGIAGSSALNVAVCGALAQWTGLNVDGEKLITIAMNLEAQVINVPTGLQDYRPAYYGGIAAIELRPDGINRVAMPVTPDDLQRRIVLAYTGAPHFSGTNNWEIMKRHVDGDRDVIECFDRIVEAAGGVRDALTRGDWTGLAAQISLEWEARKKLAPGVTTPTIEALMAGAFAAGARAAKVCGAGGGGCLFCLADPKDVPAVQSALTAGGARVLDYRIETDGLRIETTENTEN
jgi:D-glycero-alpha-D-manno-heptose-7-phosphate kinase